MRGGAILVHGDAGHEIGCSMRRGLIAVGGRTGDFVGASMIAGTILLFSQPGMRMGAGMRRGTIAVFADAPPPLPTFRFDCTYRPDFLQLYFGHLRSCNFPAPPEPPGRLYHRYSGDMVTLGKGELLIAA
jgi:formylmethanofuran dehydrogenase subunit C